MIANKMATKKLRNKTRRVMVLQNIIHRSKRSILSSTSNLNLETPGQLFSAIIQLTSLSLSLSLSLRYLTDQRWLKQWKKYAGFESWDLRSAGKQETNPGPIDNSGLFKCMCVLVKYRAIYQGIPN